MRAFQPGPFLARNSFFEDELGFGAGDAVCRRAGFDVAGEGVEGEVVD